MQLFNSTTARYMAVIEYNGTAFHGWQQQKGAISVQETIQHAVLACTHENVTIFAAGRTDAGVHALGQVIHFDLQHPRDCSRLMDGINHYIRGYGAVITHLKIVDNEFHARFSAIFRSYRYVIINRRAPLTVDRDYAWHVREQLDPSAMQEAGNFLVGYHDFSSFRSSQCQAKSACRTLSHLTVSKHDNNRIHIDLQAPSFLHNQVRIIVGCLRRVGCGRWSPDHLEKVLLAKNRTATACTAPAHGLYLMNVGYPPQYC